MSFRFSNTALDKGLPTQHGLYLKLDSVSSSFKGKLLGIPISKFLPDICQEALVLFALSRTKNKRDACVMMGINMSNFNKMLKKYNIILKNNC